MRVLRRDDISQFELVATFESGRYDERGNLRTSSPLWEMFAVECFDGLFPPSVGEQYLRVTDASHPLATVLNAGQLLPRPAYTLQVQPAPDTFTLIGVMNPLPSLYTPSVACLPMLGQWLDKRGRGVWCTFPRSWRQPTGL